MKKGEIWLVELPSVDGHEQIGKRPAIIISETETNIAIIIPLTSNIQALRFPNVIEVRPSKKNGLGMISVALIFQIRAIDKKRVKSKIGDLGLPILEEVDNNLRKMLSL